MKVLIIDDDPIVRMVLSEVLQTHGACEVLTAENGKEATRVYTENEDEICFVTIDLQMPDFDGIEFMQFLFERQSEAKVIVVSGAPDSIRRGAMALAAVHNLNVIGSLGKPVPISEFQKLAASALGTTSEENCLP